MKNKFFKIIGLITIIAFISLACGDSHGGGDGGLTNDIASELFGTWKDKTNNGTTLTITFSANGISLSGSFGNSFSSMINSYQNAGSDVAWIAKNGNISYRY